MLAEAHCLPLPKGTPPLSGQEAHRLGGEVPDWSSDGRRLARAWRFASFPDALRFVDRVGALAESEGHHPDLHLTGARQVRIELSTHSAGGLTGNDFVLAARIDRLPGAGSRLPGAAAAGLPGGPA